MTESQLPARAWIEGYGSRLVPLPPFEVARLREGDRVVFAHHGAEGVRSIMVAPPRDGGSSSVALGRDTTSLGQVLAFIEETVLEPGWQIVTRELRAAWPVGSTLWSTPYEARWPFELTFGQGGDQLAYAQGPMDESACPALDSLVGEGMRAGQRGTFPGTVGACSWLDLHYTVEGAAWIQRRVRVPAGRETVVLVTAQSPAEHAAIVLEGAAHLASTLTRRE